MNRNQKILTIAALALFCVSVLWAPWEGKPVVLYPDRSQNKSRSWYAPIFLTPRPTYTNGSWDEREYKLQSQRLFYEWLAIGILYTGLFYVLKERQR